MTKPIIGSKYVTPPRSYEYRHPDGSYVSFMEFPSGTTAERLQAALLRSPRPGLLDYLKSIFA